MKYRDIAIIGFSALLTLASCGEDFLYVAQQDSLDPDDLNNSQGVELLVTSAYATLTAEEGGGSPFNWTTGGMYGGDANKGSDPGDQSVLNEMELYNTMPTNSYLRDKWRVTNRASKRVNLALQAIEKAEDMPEAKKAIRKGELYFLRALFYFEAVKVFGPYIPYIDESVTENNPKAYNDKDIYPNILSDVDVAINNLPNAPGDGIGRAYKWAAVALKAKILMQQGNLSEAKPLWADLLANGQTASKKPYGLADDMNDNWDSFKDNSSPESIFEIQFSSDAQYMGNSGMALCYPHNSGPGGCCGFYQPSFELVNSFQVDEEGLPFLENEYRARPSVSRKVDTDDFAVNDNTIPVDPRLDFAVGRYHIPYKDWGKPAKDWVRNPVNGGIFLPKKHVYTKKMSDAGYGKKDLHAGWAPGSAMNIQYLSVRDAMLLYAECLANDGELYAAMQLVNQIRRRASLDVNILKEGDGSPAANYKIAEYPPSHAAFTDRQVCMKAIRMERKLELAMEGQRWFDLSRWGGEYMAKELHAYVMYEERYIPKFAAASKLSASRTMFPIPDSEIQTMGKDENGKPYLVQPEPWK